YPRTRRCLALIHYRKSTVIEVLCVVSVFVTGGIGPLHLDPQWLAVKEAALPGATGLAVLFSTRTRFPLIRTLLYNEKVLNVKRIAELLTERGVSEVFEERLLTATYFLAGTSMFSSVMNYIIAA